MDHLEKTDGSDGRLFAAYLTSCSCPFALQFRLPCAHMVHLREAAGLALSFNLNHRWTMAAFSTSIEETGLHEGPMHAWKPKKRQIVVPVEMLKTVSSLVNAHITVMIFNGSQYFEKEVASYSQYLSRFLPSSMIDFIFTKSSLIQVLLPEAFPLQRICPPMLARPEPRLT